MFGAMAKTWYAEKQGLNPKDIFVVGIMPCTAKKFEVQREDEAAAGVPDCDVALTTRELAKLAGVSQSTVSRSLRNSPSISPETRDRIHDMAKQRGYKRKSRGQRADNTADRKAIAVLTNGNIYLTP